MRTESEILNLILTLARQDERIRAVGMNGSRVNVNAPADKLRDFDIVYFASDVASFLGDESWLAPFGERLITQKPDEMVLFPHPSTGCFAYLMLFADGNRIDLTLVPLQDFTRHYQDDHLFRLLLDKDGLPVELPEPSDADYWLKQPSCCMLDDCCNEFWWVSTYVAKGLWRGEFPYAARHLEIVRNQLLTMLSWKVGTRLGFNFSIGKDFKYLKRYLEATEWQALLATYRLGSEAECWQALFAAQSLFTVRSQQVAAALGFPLPTYSARVAPFNQSLFMEWETWQGV